MGNLKMLPEKHTNNFTVSTHDQLLSMLHAAVIFAVSVCGADSFTYDDASSDAEADGHAEACGLVTTLLRGRHVFIDSLKVKGVDQPSSEWKQRGRDSGIRILFLMCSG